MVAINSKYSANIKIGTPELFYDVAILVLLYLEYQLIEGNLD